MKELVSVIVPIYNVELYIEKCVLSIVNQTYQNLEIILVDDGSPDDCPAICDSWKERDSRVVVIHKENGGLSDARNAGLDIASGDYILFVDSDDWIDLNMVETLLMTATEHQADICACGINDVFPNGISKRLVREIAGTANEILPLIYQDTLFPVSAWNKIYKKELWDCFRFPCGKQCEDAFTTYLLVERASKIVQISDPLYHYRIREGSIMTASFTPKKMDEEEAWRNNWLHMKEHHPDIYKLAYGFYLEKVVLIHKRMTKKEKNTYPKEDRYLRSVLRRNFFFVLCCTTLTWKKKIRMLLYVIVNIR